MRTSSVYLPDMVGRGYKDFWHFKGRYRIVKGSRASKKSKTAALWFIYNVMKYPGANLLVIRKVFRTLKDSCFTELKWAINRLGVSPLWDVKESPLEMTYRPTGQKIYFRGLDEPMKVTSITVEIGALCWLWLEEGYEIFNEADFDMLDESIRGEVPQGLFKQLTITFNPWNERHWIKKRFFDADTPNVLAMTTNYRCNEWLDAADREMFELMRTRNPRRYQVAGLGNWGIVEGVIYENWREEAFKLDEVHNISAIKSAFGLDFGFVNDPSALFCGLIDPIKKRLFVFDEIYAKGLSNEAIFAAIEKAGYRKELVRADSAEPKSIARLRELGMPRVRAARKGPDSVRHGIDFIQDFEIIIHPNCVNFLTEIGMYTWDKDKNGNTINNPVDDANHLMDAMRYALEPFSRAGAFSFD